MKILELFSGTESFSKVGREKGHICVTVDNNPEFKPAICGDFLKINDLFLISDWDIVWASPPCTTFSVASIGKHWKGGKGAYVPKTEKCLIGLKLLEKTIRIIAKCKPKYWFIENPRGVMRKVIDELFKKYNIKKYKRATVTYCQYGDSRMKPTDIWHNSNWKPRPMCKNGSPCHVAAPRGSRTGTQGLKGNKERSVVPKQLCKEILEAIE